MVRYQDSLLGMAVFVVLSCNPALGAPLPEYREKPDSWRSGLAAETDACDGTTDVVWDNALVFWIEVGLDHARLLVGGTWSFSLRCSFTQCFAGGFLTALDKSDDLDDFGANAACTYFQTTTANNADTWSHYAHAWSFYADNFIFDTDKEITESAYTGLLDGDLPDIPQHSRIKLESTQYLTNTAPEFLAAADHNLAILFAGDPDPRHIQNVTDIYTALLFQGFAAADIYILFGCHDAGNPVGVPGLPWASDAKATQLNLINALYDEGEDGFFVKKIVAAAQASGNPNELNDDVQLFFWTTDHGTVQAPVTCSVADGNGVGTTGLPGSGVRARGTGPNADEERWLFEGGTGSNTQMWNSLFPDIVAFSFGNDAITPDPDDGPPLQDMIDKPSVYFSVDEASLGLPPSDVFREWAINLVNPANDVYAMAGGAVKNRKMIDSEDLGLLEDNTVPDYDDLNALSFLSFSTVSLPDPGDPENRLARTEFYFCVDGNNWIFRWDPVDGVEVWEYWTLNNEIDGIPIPGAPPLIDALALNADFDEILYSVPPGLPGWDPAVIYRFSPANGLIAAPFITGADLGLWPDDDVNALHTANWATPYNEVQCLPPPPDPVAFFSDGFDGPCLDWIDRKLRVLTDDGAFVAGEYRISNIVPDTAGPLWPHVAGNRAIDQTMESYRARLDFRWEQDGDDHMMSSGLLLADGAAPNLGLIVSAGNFDDQGGAPPQAYVFFPDEAGSATLGPSLGLVDAASVEYQVSRCGASDWRITCRVLDAQGTVLMTQSDVTTRQPTYVEWFTNNHYDVGIPYGMTAYDEFLMEPVPPCLADINGDGTVDVIDFLAMLAEWGPCPSEPEPCLADLDCNGTVDVVDFLALLAAWGPCPP
jgi:hypothetical protein